MKRFANVAGETISLALAENCASSMWPDHSHAAVAVPDERKGEQIVLLTTNPLAQRADLVSWAQSHGVAEIALPRRIFHTDDIPVFVTGKPDYAKIEKTVLSRMAVG